MIVSSSTPDRADILGSGAVADARLGVATLAWAHVAPLVHRFRRGEGLLLAVSVSIGLSARPDAWTFLAQTVVSTAVIALLYLLNDVHDSPQDLSDAGKDQALVRFYVQRRAPLCWLLAVEHAGAVALALALLGPRSAIAVATVLLVNVAYSVWFKGWAVVDVFWVAVWGAACAAIPGVKVPAAVLALVGIMTSICHVFQITRDRPVDGVNGVRTSAVAAGWLPILQLATACLAMGLVLGELLGPAAAVSAAVPLVLRLTIRSNQAAWMLSKVYYGAVWLLALGALSGR